MIQDCQSKNNHSILITQQGNCQDRKQHTVYE